MAEKIKIKSFISENGGMILFSLASLGGIIAMVITSLLQ